MIRQVHDQADVVLDQQHRHLGGERPDQRGGVLGVAVAHALGRLVEHQHLRLAGERHRDLEAALLAVRKLRHRKPRLVGEAETLQQLGHTGAGDAAR